MADLVQWLQANNLTNPHAVPDSLQDEFDSLFGDTVIAWPQPGGQEAFSNCSADIAIFGGMAGGGKSWVLIQENGKWANVPGYEGCIVRKTFPQVFGPGGLWWKAHEQLGLFGAVAKQSGNPHYKFPSGAKVYFKHSQHAAKIDYYWQGLEIPYIGIDELTQFSREEFLYMMSRNRSTTGINSYIRATCNPDPNSWVKELIKWWIDDDGYVIRERSGVVRYVVHIDDDFKTGETAEELKSLYPGCAPKSLTFILGEIEENKILMKNDPGYLESLQNLTGAQKKALAGGNWNHYDRIDALFTHANFNKYRVAPEDVPDLKKIVIGIDPAGSTSKNSDDTGIVAAGTDGKDCYVLDDRTGKFHPNDWSKEAIDTYDELGADFIIVEFNFGGEMVKNTIEMYLKAIGRSDVKVKIVHASRGKFQRAEPVAALYSNGKVHHVGHSKLKRLESESASFKEGQDKSPNRMDAMVWAITELAVKAPGKVFRIG